MEKLDSGRMFVAVMETGRFVAAAQRLETCHGQASKLITRAAYHGIFKCNRNQLREFSYLNAYLLRVLDIPGIRDTVNIDHIKQGYYSIKALNPNMIVPAGPDLSQYGL